MTTEFLVVIGRYNAAVVKGFAQPVVALPRGWFPDYKYFYPFSTARRCQFVITRVVPTATATVDVDPAATKAAAASANFDVNVAVVTALARDPWARKCFKISNAGVLNVAQHRFRATDYFARQEYFKQFVDLPAGGDARGIAEMCRPPQSTVLAAPIVPVPPVAESQFAWDMLSDEGKASLLYAWSDTWLRPTPTAEPTRREPVTIVIPEPKPPADAEWRPTPEQLASLRSDDWKRW